MTSYAGEEERDPGRSREANSLPTFRPLTGTHQIVFQKEILTWRMATSLYTLETKVQRQRLRVL